MILIWREYRATEFKPTFKAQEPRLKEHNGIARMMYISLHKLMTSFTIIYYDINGLITVVYVKHYDDDDNDDDIYIMIIYDYYINGTHWIYDTLW